MGRKNIEIERINSKNRRKVTCTKRRQGLFRKAAELCNMCGAGISILTTSPAGKFYDFGHPDVDSIIARYCGDETSFTVNENHDCFVSHEVDEEDLEGEQERELEASTDEVDEQERELEVSSDEVNEQERELEVSSNEVHEPIEMGCSSQHAGEEKELNNNIKERDLPNHINEEIDGSQEFWWDKEKPIDAEQVGLYYQSLAELRNNVAWVLNDRNTRESYVKDYLSMI